MKLNDITCLLQWFKRYYFRNMKSISNSNSNICMYVNLGNIPYFFKTIFFSLKVVTLKECYMY